MITVDARRVGRDGALRLAFVRRGTATVMTGCRYTLPLQVLTPLALDDAAAVVSILNPTGGLVGGDRLVVEVDVGEAAHVCLTTPSATKVYRTEGEPAEQEVTLRLAAAAVLEWVPDHAIPFAGSAFRQAIRVEVGEGARLILVDAFAAGRVARDEAWRFSLLESSLALRDRHGWLLRDRLRLAGPGPWRALGFTEGRPYWGTLVVVGEGSPDALRRELADTVGARADVDVAVGESPRGVVLVRCLAAAAPALTETLDAAWRVARRRVLGRQPLALRKP